MLEDFGETSAFVLTAVALLVLSGRIGAMLGEYLAKLNHERKLANAGPPPPEGWAHNKGKEGGFVRKKEECS